MRNKYSYLSKNILLFTLSGFIPKILSFVLVPIYTNVLTTSEYGIADLITTTVSLLIPIFTLDIQDAVMRYALDEQNKKEEVFSAAMHIIFIGSILVGVGTIIVACFQISSFSGSYLFFFAIMYIITATHNSVTLFCKGIEKVNIIVISSILNSAITLIANILFLTVFHWGLNGYLLANTIGSFVALIYCFIGAKLYKFVKAHVNKLLLKDMLIFSTPIIFSVIAWWINSSSSRYIITGLLGVGASGLFAIAYKIPNLLAVFQNVFSQAWSISAVKEFDKEDKDGFIGNMYNLISFCMIAVCSIIMLLNVPCSKILYSNEFFEAWIFIPPLLIATVFNAIALFVGSIFTAIKDTKILSLSTIIGSVVTIALNVLLISLFGAYGASIAALIGYSVTLVLRLLFVRKVIHMRIKWWRDIIAYALLIAQMIFAYFGNQFILLQGTLLVGIIALYFDQVARIFSTIKKMIGKLLGKAV